VYSNYNLIKGNTSYGNYAEGITVWYSTNDNIINNNLYGSLTSEGIALITDNYIVVSGNSIHDNPTTVQGMQVFDVNSSIISGNRFENNGIGLDLITSDGNLVEKNVFTNNSNYGIFVQSDSENNRIYNNSFLRNSVIPQARDYGSNYWDDGSRGNYWDDWQTPDTDNNGIVDLPRTIAGVVDSYPLVLDFAPTVSVPVSPVVENPVVWSRISWIINNWASNNSSQQDQLGSEISAIIIGWAAL
jgi:parallel beta-helix repeat protein